LGNSCEKQEPCPDDLGSKNGTYEKLSGLSQLFSGDFVFLGQQLFRVELNV